MKKLFFFFVGYIIACITVGSSFAYGKARSSSVNSGDSTAGVNGAQVERGSGVITNIKIGNSECNDGTSCIMATVGKGKWLHVNNNYNLDEKEGYAFLQMLMYSKTMGVPVALYDHGSDTSVFDEIQILGRPDTGNPPVK